MTRREKPEPLLEGRDYYCGTCIGKRYVLCDYCVDGCRECWGKGQVKCPQCKGGEVPVPPPLDLRQG